MRWAQGKADTQAPTDKAPPAFRASGRWRYPSVCPTTPLSDRMLCPMDTPSRPCLIDLTKAAAAAYIHLILTVPLAGLAIWVFMALAADIAAKSYTVFLTWMPPAPVGPAEWESLVSLAGVALIAIVAGMFVFRQIMVIGRLTKALSDRAAATVSRMLTRPGRTGRPSSP